MDMPAPDVEIAGATWESRAFFAALLAACRGQDQEAAAILRSIADRMSLEFTKEAPKAVGKR